MIRFTLLLFTFVCSLFCGLYAQHAYFPTKGIISFEREVYLRARMREMSSKSSGQNRGMMMRYNSNVDDIPEKNSSFFTLQFDQTATLMSAVDEESATTTSTPSRTPSRGGRRPNSGRPERMGRSAMRGGSPDKIFYQNLTQGSSLVQMELDEKYVLEDSLQQITWRFTDEYRQIAGYECRRVNGATPDSLYIVAFYTDQIPVSGGPALVHGLPGMILGLAIPEMHINYWAQKVDFVTDNVPQNWKDKKAKEMNMQELFESLGKNRFFGGGNNRNQMKRNLLENLIY
jgi:GLPGLI family protein